MNTELIEQQRLLYGKIPSSVNRLYLAAILLVTAMLTLSFFVELDVTVKADGITRPSAERTIVRAAINGNIDSIFVAEGSRVKKGELLVLLYDSRANLAIARLENDKKQKSAQLADLQLLTGSNYSGSDMLKMLSTSVYAEELLQFDLTYEEKKVESDQFFAEHATTLKLFKEGIIPSAQCKAEESKLRQMTSRLAAMKHQQMVHWNNYAQSIKKELREIEQELDQWHAIRLHLQIRAPVAGVIQGIHDRYTTGFIQAGEILCTVSPEDRLVAECFIDQADIGFLRLNQPVSLGVEAFDHYQFGKVNGSVIFIDNDFTSVNNRPFFKVRCSIAESGLTLKNGYKAKLLKGLTVQANFLITKRTIWQLFSDRFSDWMHPVMSV